MQEGQAALRRRARHRAGGVAVDGVRQRGFAFRPVDRGIGGGVDDQIGGGLPHGFEAGRRVGEIGGIAAERGQRDARGHPPREFAGKLPGRPENQNTQPSTFPPDAASRSDRAAHTAFQPRVRRATHSWDPRTKRQSLPRGATEGSESNR